MSPNRGPTVRWDGAIEQFDKGCDMCHRTGVVWNDPTTGFPCPYCRADEYDGRIVRPDGSVEQPLPGRLEAAQLAASERFRLTSPTNQEEERADG